MTESKVVAELAAVSDAPSLAFIPYPTSTLSPAITPPDLSSFKARNITEVQRDLSEQLLAVRRETMRIIDAFNWNKIVYESEFSFEPVIGQIYYLYQSGERFRLSMIEPRQWPGQRFVASFRLAANGKWEPQEVADHFDLHEYVSSRNDMV